MKRTGCANMYFRDRIEWIRRISTTELEIIKLWKYYFIDKKLEQKISFYKGVCRQDTFLNQIGKLDKQGS